MELEFGAGPICRGYTQAEGYTINLSPATTTTGAAGTPGTLRDAATSVISGATVDTVFSAQLTDTPDDGTTITNLTPGVATFSGSAVAQWVSNGIARVQASHPTFGTSVVWQLVQRVAQSIVTKFTGYQSGSVAADISSMIDTAISGVTASLSTTTRFSSVSNNARNTNLWCKNIVDTSAITREADTFTLNVLIGPKHCLFAWHVGCAGQLGFFANDLHTYVATVVSTAQISGTDIGIAYLRDATTAEINSYNAAHSGSRAAIGALSLGIGQIKPFAMFPSNVWASSNCALCLDPNVAALPNFIAVPVMHTTRSNAIALWDISQAPRSIVYTDGHTYTGEFEIQQAKESNRSPFAAVGNTGATASGDITFTAIPTGTTMATNNSSLGAGYPILLGTTHGSPGGSAYETPWCALQSTAISALMKSLAQAAGDPSYATYAPITVSLTGYTTY